MVMGAGVIGLTTAVLLAEQGSTIEIIARERRMATTSAAACAVWLPLFVAEDERLSLEGVDMMDEWQRDSYLTFEELSGQVHYGVRETRLHRIGRREADRPRVPAEMVGLTESVVVDPSGASCTAWSMRSFVIDMPRYLEALEARLVACGHVTFREEDVQELSDVAASAAGRVVFNCSGLGAREVCPDPALTPVKGVLLFHERNGFEPVVSYDSYVVAERAGSLVLGALSDAAYDTEDVTPEELERLLAFHSGWGDWDLTPLGLVPPSIHRDRVCEAIAGLRPVRRGGVRLDVERVGETLFVHNYGHGGAGVTLSWGTARHAVSLAECELAR
jgi:D-amino-acid oxidase